MAVPKTPATEAYWAEFTSATATVGATYTVVAFGDSPAMADELAALVLSGRKRATASLLRDYDCGREAVPRVGDFVVVVDGAGHPRCIWRTTEVTVKPLIEVDDAFARDEGEGDGSRAYWLDAHRQYFAAQARRQGFAVSDGSDTVFERFEVVWPPEGAERLP